MIKNKKKLLIIIPAKKNSSRVKNKNLRKIGNKSLLELKIQTCLKSKLGDVFVSTDSPEIAKISKKNGAIAPYLRDKKYSRSNSSMISCVLEVLRYLTKNNKNIPNYIAVIPPTNPFITSRTIKRAYKLLSKNKNTNSIYTYSSVNDHPYTFVDNINQKLKFNILKYKNKFFKDFERTQDYPKAYVLSGAIRMSKTDYLLKFIKKTLPIFNMNVADCSSCIGLEISKREAFDINNYDDLSFVKYLQKNKKVFV